MRRKINKFRIEGNNVYIDISSPRLLNVETIIDKQDLSLIVNSTRRWTATKTAEGTSYVVRKVGKRSEITELLHRIIMQPSENEEVDHKNLNPLDNRRNNLRLVTRSQNSKNRRKIQGTSKYRGVSWCKRDACWRAYCVIDKKRKALGSFNSEVEAAKAYDAAVSYDPFYNLNFPHEKLSSNC